MGVLGPAPFEGLRLKSGKGFLCLRRGGAAGVGVDMVESSPPKPRKPVLGCMPNPRGPELGPAIAFAFEYEDGGWCFFFLWMIWEFDDVGWVWD